MTQTDINAPYVDNGNAVIAVNYVFIIITLVTTVLRIGSALFRKRAFGLDDILLILAVPFGLLSAICTGNAVVNGLGRPIIMVHSGQLANYFKFSYAAHMFMITAMAAAQASVVALINRITPKNSPKRRYIRLLYPIIGGWVVLAVFGIAFQCGVPEPWIYQPGRCTGHGFIWYPTLIVAVVVDVVLAFGYLPATLDMQIETKDQMIIMSLFLARLIVPVLTIVHLAVIIPALQSQDQTSVMAIPTIVAQVAMNFSIMTAALPVISRMVIDLESRPSKAIPSETTAVVSDGSHSRTTSNENKKLRDWAFAQLRNSPTPNSLIKDFSIQHPEPARLALGRVDTTLDLPDSFGARSRSPKLALNLDQDPPQLDAKEAWFVDSKRTSAMTESTIEHGKRVSQGI